MEILAQLNISSRQLHLIPSKLMRFRHTSSQTFQEQFFIQIFFTNNRAPVYYTNASRSARCFTIRKIKL